MSYKPSDSYYGQFTTRRFDTGVGINADSLPSATATKDGTDDGSFSLTVTNIDTGRYKVTGTIPGGYTAGDVVHISVAATVNSIADKAVIDSFVLDSKRNADLNDLTAAAAGTDAASKVLATPAQKLATDGSGNVTLKAATHTGAVIPTVTAVTNDVGITQAGADKAWTSTTRQITGLTAAAIKSIWDQLTSGLTTAGSIGKFLVDNVNTLLTRLSQTRADYLDKLNITGNVAASGEVTAIQNNTRVRVIVPPAIERPDSGSTAYKLHLYIYDTEGNMEAPDSLPTIAAENEAGTDRSGNLGTVTLESTGHYYVTYTVSSSHAIEQVRFEWSVVEGGATRLHGDVAQIVDTTAVDFTSADRTKLDTLHDSRLTAARATNLDNLDATVSSRSTLTPAQVNAEVDNALNTAIPGTPTADSINERVKSIDDKLPTGTISDFDPATDNVIVGDILAAALAKFFTTATTKTYADAVAQSVVKEIAANAAGGGGGETQLRAGTAQGGTASTITLDAGASSIDDFYKHVICALVGGTGAGQAQIIDSYVGSTKVGTPAASWAVAPDNTTQFVLLPLGTIPGASAPSAAAVADAVFDEARADHKGTGSFGEAFNRIHAGEANKLQDSKSTGETTVYEDDGATVSHKRTLTKVDDDKVALVPS